MANDNEDAEMGDAADPARPLLSVRMDPLSLIGTHAALAAAIKTGLWSLLHSGPHTIAECAEKRNLSLAATACVVEILVKSGIAMRKGSRYQLELDLRDPEIASLAGPYEMFQRQFDHTPHLLRTGEPLAFMDESAQQRETSYRNMVGDMGRGFTVAARLLASKLPLLPRHILDVGCGSGVWSLELAARHPETQVTGIDFPQVLEVFEARAHKLGLERQITKLPGDMYEVELPREPVDLIIIANVLRLEAAEKAKALVARFASAVRPGGALLVVDAFAGGTPERELHRAVYALYLALRTSIGRVYSPEEVTQWLREAALAEPTVIDLGSQFGALGALLSERPQ